MREAITIYKLYYYKKKCNNFIITVQLKESTMIMSSLVLNFLMFLSSNLLASTSDKNLIVTPKDHHEQKTLVKQLWQTHLINKEEVHQNLQLKNYINFGFKTINPYYPRYTTELSKLSFPKPKKNIEYTRNKNTITFYNQELVAHWYNTLSSNSQVCALKFVDKKKTRYRLKTFNSRQEAIESGFVVTHDKHCGTCSSLKDLAIYLSKPDLTTPVRKCAKKFMLQRIKKCLKDQVNFSDRCSETWAYNCQHTRKVCLKTCIKYYGLWNILTNNMDNQHVNTSNKLNPCLACDEYKSGPGFKYTAGRTRRGSGIESAIKRKTNEIYHVDHSLYFK